jgi:hypothetical protein
MADAQVQKSQTTPDRFDVVFTSDAGAETVIALGFKSQAHADSVARSIRDNAGLDAHVYVMPTSDAERERRARARGHQDGLNAVKPNPPSDRNLANHYMAGWRSVQGG